MKIGVLGCFYGCADMLPEVLAPWLAQKREGKSIVISAVNAQFKEYADLGYQNDDDATRAALFSYGDEIDHLHIMEEPLQEHEARNIALRSLLESGVDLVWMLDGDEVYTKEQIQDIIGYVERTPRFSYYHIHFDNHILDTLHSLDAFCPPRIIRTDRHGGIDGFVWDNEVSYKDGSRLEDLVPGIVPWRIAFVYHRTWYDHEGSLKRKIAYQRKHFGYCPFMWDEKTGTAAYDPAYFRSHRMPMPEIRDGKVSSPPQPVLEVVLRTHSTGDLRAGPPRLCDAHGGKGELSIRALRSLGDALLVLARQNDVRMKLAVIDDYSSAEFAQLAARFADECPFDVTLIATTMPGNGPSLRTSFEYARQSDADLLYFVEDDYLHVHTALAEMVEAYRLFSNNLRKREVALHPVDYIDRYAPQELSQPTRVVLGTRRHWRTITKTTGTFFIPKILLLSQWQNFVRLCDNGFNESASINQVWERHAVAFGPIPTLAIHLHDEHMLPPFSRSLWRELWDDASNLPH